MKQVRPPLFISHPFSCKSQEEMRSLIRSYTFRSMTRRLLIFAVVAGIVPMLTAQNAPPEHPKVLLTLPAGTKSEMAQVNYYMVGPFGGYGMWVRPDKNRTTYEIDASVEGQAARNLKAIAWLPSCEIITLDIPINADKAERELTCKALPSVDFTGQIFPGGIANGRSAEVEASYVAAWSHGFFGIFDGPVTTFNIGKAIPDADGIFHIKLPDVASQSGMSEGQLDFILREKNSGNIIAFLKAMDATSNAPGKVKVLHEYPLVVRFAAEER